MSNTYAPETTLIRIETGLGELFVLYNACWRPNFQAAFPAKAHVMPRHL